MVLLYCSFLVLPIWIGLRSFFVLDGQEKWVGLVVTTMGSVSLAGLLFSDIVPYYRQPDNGWLDVYWGFRSIIERPQGSY